MEAPRNNLSSAAFTEEISQFEGEIQGIFGSGRIGEKPGPVPRVDQVGVHKCGPDRACRGADLRGPDGGESEAQRSLGIGLRTAMLPAF